MLDNPSPASDPVIPQTSFAELKPRHQRLARLVHCVGFMHVEGAPPRDVQADPSDNRMLLSEEFRALVAELEELREADAPPGLSSAEAAPIEEFVRRVVRKQLKTTRFNHLMRAAGTEEDVRQAALVAVVNAWKKYDPSKGPWQPYVTTVTVNALAGLNDTHRATKRNWRKAKPCSALKVDANGFQGPDAASEDRDGLEQKDLLQGLMNVLPESDRRLLGFIREVGIEAAQAALGMPESTMRSRLRAIGKRAIDEGFEMPTGLAPAGKSPTKKRSKQK
ncbi:MAG: RNA polymerase sigma factor [Phycisphaerales bacterium]